jgi:hypothetical protein
MKRLLVCLGMMFALTGCGPIVSGVQIVNANIALSAAATAGAKQDAVYEYTAAQEYLRKAREENAYSDFWAARIYADKALDLALKARKRAEIAAATRRGPDTIPTLPPSGTEIPPATPTAPVTPQVPK